ncbi:unnamed protein product [Withania somnifera]
MAGFSSGIRLSQFTSLKNEILIMGSMKDSNNFTFVKNQDFVGKSKICYLVCKNNYKSRFLVKSSLNEEGNSAVSVRVDTVLKENETYSVGKDVSVLDADNGGDGKGELADGNGGNGKYHGGGGGGGGGGGDNGEGDEEEEEFGSLLKFEDVMREAQARGATLPADMIEAAKSVGIRKLLLLRYLDLQNRMLADPSFLFKVGTEGILYGFFGFGCGIIGQGIANMIMTAKRSVKKSEDDVPVPPLVKSAVLWGVFLGVSSNTRLQIVTGLERLVESSPVGKPFPPVAMAFTVGVRFANKIYAGMQFVDWARWSGMQ